MALLSKLFQWGRTRQRERPSARQESNQRTKAESRQRAQAKIQEQVSARSRAGAADWDARERARKQREIQERIAQDRARGFIPTGTLVDDHDVPPWEADGSTGVSILDPTEVGDALDRSDLEAFLRGDMAIFTDSSNVQMLRYFPASQELEVTFKAKGNRPESVYVYSDISTQLAASSIIATSKGSWVWDSLRIRGTKYGHQKAYRRIR